MPSKRSARASTIVLGLAALAGIAYALRWRANPSPCPYSQRRLVDVPRPVLTRARVRDSLAPKSGERILELGPGTGYYTGEIAAALEPNGTLHAVDVQRAMVDHLRTTTERDGTVEPVRGDGRALPYPDDQFDAAYMILVLGEIPDQERTLGELERVLKPDGRLVVGELLPDPHFVTRGTLRRRAEREGLRLDALVGTRLGYVARLSPSESAKTGDE